MAILFHIYKTGLKCVSLWVYRLGVSNIEWSIESWGLTQSCSDVVLMPVGSVASIGGDSRSIEFLETADHVVCIMWQIIPQYILDYQLRVLYVWTTSFIKVYYALCY